MGLHVAYTGHADVAPAHISEGAAIWETGAIGGLARNTMNMQSSFANHQICKYNSPNTSPKSATPPLVSTPPTVYDSNCCLHLQLCLRLQLATSRQSAKLVLQVMSPTRLTLVIPQDCDVEPLGPDNSPPTPCGVRSILADSAHPLNPCSPAFDSSLLNDFAYQPVYSGDVTKLHRIIASTRFKKTREERQTKVRPCVQVLALSDIPKPKRRKVVKAPVKASTTQDKAPEAPTPPTPTQKKATPTLSKAAKGLPYLSVLSHQYGRRQDHVRQA